MAIWTPPIPRKFLTNQGENTLSKRLEKLPFEKIREIALLGQSGLDYAAADKKYKLRALLAEHFSDLEIMCLMFAAFKRVAPVSVVGMNLDESFLVSLELLNNRLAEF